MAGSRRVSGRRGCPVANAGWLVDVVDAVRTVNADLDLLVAVQVKRRTAERDEATGRRAFADAVSADAKIAGMSHWKRSSSESLRDARYTVDLFGVSVEPGDRIAWDGEDHTVLTVDGLVRDADGSRYQTRAVVD